MFQPEIPDQLSRGTIHFLPEPKPQCGFRHFQFASQLRHSRILNIPCPDHFMEITYEVGFTAGIVFLFVLIDTGKQREEQLHRSSKMSLDTLAAQMAAGDVKDLNIIIKADVQGSVEAVQQSLEKLSNDEVKIKVIHGAVGAINESDIVLADVSNAIIIGFNVRPSQMIVDKAKETGVDIRLYSVIYNAIEDVENAMKGMLAPKIEEVVWGHAEVRQLFKVSGIGTIGGCYVTDGKIQRASNVRVIRDDVVIYTGVLGSLQHEKDSVKEVVSGHECGLTVEKYNDIKIGDVIEAFGNVEVKRD